LLLTVNNDPPYNIPASRSGAVGSFTMGVVVVPLVRGTNLISLSVAASWEKMDIDCVILEKIGPFRFIRPSTTPGSVGVHNLR